MIYANDPEQDGITDYKEMIDVDKDGRIDITKYGIADNSIEEGIVWHTVIQDISAKESFYQTEHNIQIRKRFFLKDFG